MKQQYRSKLTHVNGLSLLELSVVMAIVGIIIGFISLGSEIVANAKVKSEIQQIQDYDAGVSLFKDLYGYIPGDATPVVMNQVFGARFINDPYSGGDGNGNLRCYLTDVVLCANPDYGREVDDFFYHLSIAGLITKSYMLVNYAPNYYIGVNYPISELDERIGILPYNDSFGRDQYLVGLENNTSILTITPSSIGISPNLLYNLDSKIDDGLPISGSVKAYLASSSWPPSGSGQTASDCYVTNVYNSHDNPKCIFTILMSHNKASQL